MYTLRNEGQHFVIAGVKADKHVFFTGAFHDGNVPQLTDNPIDAAQFATADEADALLTRPGYREGLRVKRFVFELVPDTDPRTQMPWLDGPGGKGGRPIGTMIMQATEVT